MLIKWQHLWNLISCYTVAYITKQTEDADQLRYAEDVLIAQKCLRIFQGAAYLDPFYPSPFDIRAVVPAALLKALNSLPTVFNSQTEHPGQASNLRIQLELPHPPETPPTPDEAMSSHGQPLVYEGDEPVYIGSALQSGPHDSVVPCKVIPTHSRCQYAFNGQVSSCGRCEILRFHAATMEWVAGEHGRLPEGRAPVLGGYEPWPERDPLYYALRTQDMRLGKAGPRMVCDIVQDPL